MRDALLGDLAELPDIEVTTTHDARVSPAICGLSIPVGHQDDVWQIWGECIAVADAVWLVAPEAGGVLTRLTAMVNDQHKTLLGSSIEAVRVATSKYATGQALQAAGVSTVSTYTFDEWPQNSPGPWVAKVDDGVGCENSAYFESSATLLNWMRQGRESTHIIQPYQKGTPASISMLCHEGRTWLLSCNTQKIALQEYSPEIAQFSYTGSVLNGMAKHWGSFEEIASQVAQVMPGLAGYAGIDVVVDEGQVYVLEINPRLTTSYAGLRRATGCNVAQMVIDLLYNRGLQFPQKISREVVEISLND